MTTTRTCDRCGGSPAYRAVQLRDVRDLSGAKGDFVSRAIGESLMESMGLRGNC